MLSKEYKSNVHRVVNPDTKELILEFEFKVHVFKNNIGICGATLHWTDLNSGKLNTDSFIKTG